MKPGIQRLKYFISDLLAASISWSLFVFFRKGVIESAKYGIEISPELNLKFWISLAGITLFWLILHYLSGYYRQPYRKSRLQELWTTFQVSVLGSLVIFFSLLLDDEIVNYRTYYLSFSLLLSSHFLLTYIPRIIITSRTNHLIFNGKLGFNTLIIGSGEKAVEIYSKLSTGKRLAGNKIIGFVNVNNRPTEEMEKHILKLGSINDVNEIIEKYGIREAIIATESDDDSLMEDVVYKLKQSDILIKTIPNLYDILSGKVKMSSVYGTPLIEISDELLPAWQYACKKSMDLVISVIALILSLPVSLTVAILIKTGSRGSVIFVQERIGKHGKPFNLYKFRTMYEESEEFGPSLSSDKDPRITGIGRLMRKMRIDEIPNFINVLKGDMSLVGPRPERKFFIDQILPKAPYYIHLQKIKPGITSWGQVKYGYAENVDQMIERLSYDLIYIEDMSIYADLKIMVYTILTILGARGK